MDEIPSWCTACYRKGRTGEHFMEFAIPGFIKRFCTPNALLTLQEYLADYASPEVKVAGAEGGRQPSLRSCRMMRPKQQLVARLAALEKGQRDLYF